MRSLSVCARIVRSTSAAMRQREAIVIEVSEGSAAVRLIAWGLTSNMWMLAYILNARGYWLTCTAFLAQSEMVFRYKMPICAVGLPNGFTSKER